MATAAKGAKPAKAKFKIDIKDPGVRNVLIAVAVIGLVSYLWVDGYLTPKIEEIKTLAAKKEKVEAELLKINALKPQLEKLRVEIAILSAKLDSLKSIFPDQKEVPRLIREMNAVNKRSNIITTRFTPMPDVVKEYYVENKYNVAVSGNYHNLGQLFSYLANFQLIVNLANVSINANPGYSGFAPGGDGKGGGYYDERPPSVFATFELTTFSSRR
ncbi:MAG: type 4a pilus biogenesis protein PilO [Chitinispirillales bacterium]|jgi:type IV pilus assembly protein PilO|nr:type 4a pilus biogenesis protein PilO [Chitinispirillales bacterium]